MKLDQAADAFRSTVSGYSGFWCVAGGWAIDLYLNRQTRSHEDLEIVALRNDRAELFRHFERYGPRKIFSGDPVRFVQWNGETIESEVVQIRLDPVGAIDFDLLLTPSEAGDWICRRDLTIRRPLADVVQITESGLPVLAPEIVLLFKAKYLREKDLADYANIEPKLSAEARQWLKDCVARIHPNHRWS
jgi:hypothetical protein